MPSIQEIQILLRVLLAFVVDRAADGALSTRLAVLTGTGLLIVEVARRDVKQTARNNLCSDSFTLRRSRLLRFLPPRAAVTLRHLATDELAEPLVVGPLGGSLTDEAKTMPTRRPLGRVTIGNVPTDVLFVGVFELGNSLLAGHQSSYYKRAKRRRYCPNCSTTFPNYVVLTPLNPEK